MKILCIGDQHFKPSNIPDVNIFLKELENWLSTNPVDMIVSMGDLLHTNERLHTEALNKAVEYIDILRKYAHTYIQVGNHDLINQNYVGSPHWLNFLKKYNNITVVDDIKIVNINDNNVKTKITLCPYVPDGRFLELLNTRKGEWEDSTLIFAHQLFDGAKMGSIIAENIEKWNEDHPMVICGHIHDKQHVQDNLYIVGSVLQEAFGETEDKSLLLIDTNNKQKISKDHFTDIYFNIPRKKILYIDVEELENFDISTLKPGIEYKLTVDGIQEEFDAFKKTNFYKTLIKKVKIVFKHKRSFLVNKRETINEQSNKKKKFNEILEELIISENNPYITNLFNKIVLNRITNDEILIL